MARGVMGSRLMRGQPTGRMPPSERVSDIDQVGFVVRCGRGSVPPYFVRWTDIRRAAHASEFGEDRPIEALILDLANADGSVDRRIINCDSPSFAALWTVFSALPTGRIVRGADRALETLWPPATLWVSDANIESKSPTLGADPIVSSFIDSEDFRRLVVEAERLSTGSAKSFLQGNRALNYILVTVVLLAAVGITIMVIAF